MVQKSQKKINLAFLINFNHEKWFGGINIILNLIEAILASKENRELVKIILVVDNKKKLKKLKINNRVKILEDTKIFKFNIILKFVEKISLLFRGKTFFLENFLLKNQINFISHSNIASGINSFTKSIVWIPDFQYLHYPKYFTRRYRIFKRINLNIYSKHSHKILLSSNDALNDLNNIKKVKPDKLIVHPFTFNVLDPNKLPKFSELRKKYFLPNKFFFLPNQYWVHKNHILVIKALKKLVKKNKNIIIVSTGQQHDYRNPNHFDKLMNLIKVYNLEKNYIYLGLIPYKEVLALIYNSVAVINPSLFEGWSSTVEQAKSYGKEIILSNINVHVEQNPLNGYFFNPHNYKSLSDIMLKVFNKNKADTFNNKFKLKMKRKFENYGKEFIKKIF